MKELEINLTIIDPSHSDYYHTDRQTNKQTDRQTDRPNKQQG